jgi:hypothetical protein
MLALNRKLQTWLDAQVANHADLMPEAELPDIYAAVLSDLAVRIAGLSQDERTALTIHVQHLHADTLAACRQLHAVPVCYHCGALDVCECGPWGENV